VKFLCRHAPVAGEEFLTWLWSNGKPEKEISGDEQPHVCQDMHTNSGFSPGTGSSFFLFNPTLFFEFYP
jgi:hypothetical protein